MQGGTLRGWITLNAEPTYCSRRWVGGRGRKGPGLWQDRLLGTTLRVICASGTTATPCC